MTPLAADGDATRVGIDVAKRTLDVALGPGGPVRTLAYDAAGLQRLDRLLAGVPNPFVCLEGTGGDERPLLRRPAAAGVPCARITPRQARRFAQATGRLDKTDRLDARVPALYPERLRPGPDEPASAQAERRKELDARRRQVVEQVVRERNRPHTAAMRKLLTILNALVKTDSDWRWAVNRLTFMTVAPRSRL